ncbi:MAG: cytochrome c oxidase subunit II [Pirellulales bacterium]|nr:cytochrome c oxidase subunit II [Pirellulales bacterium]
MPKLILLAAAASQALDVSTLSPASPPAESIRFLFIVVTAAAAFILAIVWGVLFYSLLKFRRPRLLKDGLPTTEPPQVYGSLPIEVAWTVAPGLIVFLLTLVIVRTEFQVHVREQQQPESAKILNVTVIGHQWWWEYVIERDGQRKPGVVTANELHIPASTAEQPRPIYLNLRSADVCHSFWIPRLAGKTDLIPGRNKNEMWFATRETGLYVGQCAEYCGTQHAHMLLRVYVESEAEFQAWLANETKPAVDDPSVRNGKQIFLTESCVKCHTIRGTPAQGAFGPNLTHLAARETFAGCMIPLTRDNLRKWIRDPQEIKVGCLMPAFGLSEQKIDWITDYLMSLK